MFDFKASKIPGCFELQPKVFEDVRGRFVKVFHQEAFSEQGLEVRFAEEYYSVSHKGVVRGMHFQFPPLHHVKVVYCIEGECLDAVFDLRVGSPTYGQFELFNVSAEKANILYIPHGLAHGFFTMSERAIMVYKVSTLFSPEHDRGVLWNSLGIPWPSFEVVLSARDAAFPPFNEFESPFIYA